MKNNRFFLIRVLPIFITLFLLVSAAAAESGYEPFFRFDNGLDAWQNPLKKHQRSISSRSLDRDFSCFVMKCSANVD